MSVVCGQCSRVNPSEAAYCYYDGAALAGRSGGPVHAGSSPFPNQFVFPNGTACRNFDQLASACQQNWPAATDLLKQGFLGSFFGGLGRVDLAMAAQEAAKFPDLDRGLDQLLAKLPTQALEPPKLQAEPSIINLGQIKIGQDRTTELHLTNLGMRLLYGNVVSDCKWLLIGEAPGQAEKIFQFGTESILPIQVRGQQLRAGNKPLEGHLVIDSNGGTSTVTIRADVPITPFKGSMFDGAVTPRQIAEKAKANPKDAAPFFEDGAIASWYASNGWNYPVQGPIMSGMGAIQQFFEALGVAKAPKVEFSAKSLDLQGAVGQTVLASIDVTTAERKVVYGWATCDQSWVEVGKTRLTGKVATIPITVRIPSPAPPTLQAKLNLIGNGGQKAVVPLTVTVAGGRKSVTLDKVVEPLRVSLVEPAPVLLEIADKTKKPPMSVSDGATPVPRGPFTFGETPAQAVETMQGMVEEESATQDNPFAVTGPPGPVVPAPGDAAPAPASAGAPAGLTMSVRMLLLLLPVALLGFCLLILIAHDIWFASAGAKTALPSQEGDGFADTGKVDPRPYIALIFDEGHIDKDYTDSMTFGVLKLNPADKTDAPVRLNYYPNGVGNSIVAKIDGKDATFGKQAYGSWPSKAGGIAREADKHGGRTRTFEFNNSILVTQTATIVPGDPVLTDREYVRTLSVCLAKYKIRNHDKRAHKVGLRILLDTCIGDNDGVPFTLPGVKELVATQKQFVGSEVPDFIQVLERSDLANPGIVMQLNLRVNDKVEMPTRFLLTRYPVSVSNNKKSLDKWEVPLIDMKDDSCVVMYWDEKELKPNQERELAFTYGLGSVSASSGAKLGMTVGGAMQLNGELTVVALVADPSAKSVMLRLPPGLELVQPPQQSLTQPVEASKPGPDGKSRPVPLTWRVRATSAGAHEVVVSTDTKLEQKRRVTITLKSLFN